MVKKKPRDSRKGKEYETLSGGWSGISYERPGDYIDKGGKHGKVSTVSPFGGDWDPDRAFASTLPPSFDPKGPLVKRKGGSKKRQKRGTTKKNKNKPSRRKARKRRKRRKK